jgi:hypothetical protein
MTCSKYRAHEPATVVGTVLQDRDTCEAPFLGTGSISEFEAFKVVVGWAAYMTNPEHLSK